MFMNTGEHFEVKSSFICYFCYEEVVLFNCYFIKNVFRCENTQHFSYYCSLLQVRHRFGLFDEVCTSGGVQVRHCNWVRFLRVSENYGPQVS